mmetsp:Transcript_76476/g.119493  ORF Transcript_76476/g.119493 Transcript_76476/m.119493 type:complete len:158 (-) Transcript_76476:999-1472(-)
MVVFCHWALTFENLDVHSWLIVLICRENLGLLRWNDGISGNDFRHNASDSLDSKSQRGHIQEQNIVSSLVTEDTTLYSRTICDRFVRVHSSVRLLPSKEIFNELLHFRDTCRTTDKHHIVDLIFLHAGIFHDLFDRTQRVLEKVIVEFLEPSTREHF